MPLAAFSGAQAPSNEIAADHQAAQILDAIVVIVPTRGGGFVFLHAQARAVPVADGQQGLDSHGSPFSIRSSDRAKTGGRFSFLDLATQLPPLL